MKALHAGFKGIAGRLSALSWLITIVTLSIFVIAIIPQQKQDLLDALRSKAQGVSSSLHEVTASAAVTEDYSSVVDQCLQALAGDEAIEFLVISKSDGVSVIVDRAGWRSEVLDATWRPSQREPVSLIAKSFSSDHRVFRFGRPFDYSGIQWGWIHVGLSLASYDRSVSRIYVRTGLLAVLCVVLSLLASVWYARKMVRPIQSLQEVVQRVAGGDLEARSDVQSKDEVGSLAASFNGMADSILQRNRVLESVRFAAQELLAADDWGAVTLRLLEKTGHAVGVHRAFLLKTKISEGSTSAVALRAEWVAPGLAPSAEVSFSRQRADLPEWVERLHTGEVVVLNRQQLTDGRPDGAGPAAHARILLPIQHGAHCWGLLGFDDCERERAWSDAERDTFQTLAGMLGATIARQAAQRALVEANETLEARVEERTRELQEQADAKEKARAELAVAQQRLMDLSRQAGMAEVATSVLHNVGNVLNSVNTSASVVAGKMQESRADKVVALVEMLQQNKGRLDEFLSSDAKGQRVLPYLAKLGTHLQQEREFILRELGLLTDHISHIKSIVSTQQNHATIAGLVEELSISDLVEDSVRIVDSSLSRHKIEVLRDFDNVPRVQADKHQILQILLNLLRNAKHAIAEGDQPERLIRLRIRRHEHDRIRIEVKDNGVGLPPENLTRIFAHGFTTRRNGHGFGLHSSALAARQMGGSLWAESDGPGLGACFTLELPLNAPAKAVRRGLQ